jgi:hypothetical protein
MDEKGVWSAQDLLAHSLISSLRQAHTGDLTFENLWHSERSFDKLRTGSRRDDNVPEG